MKETIKQTIKTELFLIRFMFETDTLCGILYWGLISIKYAIPLFSVWLWKLIIDELTVIYLHSSTGNNIWLYLGVYLLLQVILSVLSKIVSIIFEIINRKATKRLDLGVMQKMANIDVAFYDNPANSDKLAAAQTSESYITSNMCWMIDTVIRIIAFISGLIMFLSYNPLLGLIYMATFIPGAILSYMHRKKTDEWSLDNIPQTRKKNYYKSLLTSENTAKDLRLYDLAGYFKAKYNDLWKKIRTEREKLFVKGIVISFLTSLLTYIGIVIIMLLSVHRILLGSMAIGTLALYIGLAESSGENFKQIIEDLACQIEIDVPRVINYLEFLQYKNEIKNNGTEKISYCPEIEFRNIYFRYPGNEEYTLKNLNLKIESGKKIALIGVNGAGKTTLVKLLMRFYEPESGELLIGGKSISSYPIAELGRMFSVCFQDVQKYSLSLRENITISDIERQWDEEAVVSAAKASGVDSIIKTATSGLNTQMTRMFENDGLELSGGQWQKIALARVFFRKSQFIILDEPSSSLDPVAEDYIFSSFRELCKDRGGILISHRLSSIMMVDEIVLLDKGTVIESGTHEELMRQNGKYAQMYQLQADKYKGGKKNA